MKHIVGFSGGIDSQACSLWVRRNFPAQDIILLNSQAGRNEHPITVEFIRWYSEHIHPVVEIVPLIRDLGNRGTLPGGTRDRRQQFADDDELTFDLLAFIQGRFPSRKAQFCTQHLKLEPQLRWMRENADDLLADGYERYSGVRRDESATRANVLEREWDDYFDCYLNRPLASWTKAQCFEAVQAAGEPYNELYRMGFSRVGCAPCINAGKDDVRLWSARFPEMIAKVRGWEENNKRTFFPPCVPGLVINWIDEVVAWSKTEHGGKKLSLPFVEADAAAGACSSKYGLCE